MSAQVESPTGRFVPIGQCGTRGCQRPAAYVAEFSDWPDDMRTGACADCAPRFRRLPRLLRMRTWRDASEATP